jgi:hypothetical protein
MANNTGRKGLLTKAVAIVGSFVGLGSSLTAHADTPHFDNPGLYGAFCRSEKTGLEFVADKKTTEDANLLSREDCTDVRVELQKRGMLKDSDPKKTGGLLGEISGLKRKIGKENAAVLVKHPALKL